MTEMEGQIDRCNYLFLADIQELGGNRLRIVVSEGRATGQPRTISIGDSSIADCTPITITPESASFAIEWPLYVAYAVLNESYVGPPDAEQAYTGRRFRVYSRSHFMEYVSKTTFANNEYPGPMKHFEICCEDQVVNVISTLSPTIT